jgi:hypothetical protein
MAPRCHGVLVTRDDPGAPAAPPSRLDATEGVIEAYLCRSRQTRLRGPPCRTAVKLTGRPRRSPEKRRT